MNPAHHRITIVMAVFNAAPYLEAQLQSLKAQTCPDWDLITSDDGSQDETGQILTRFNQDSKGQHQITQLHGPQQGFVRNFFHLLRNVPPDAAFVALADQDDVWMADKLERARAALSALPEGQPGLYAARSLITDQNLTQLYPSPLFTKAPHFKNAWVQSLGGGNTMMLNHAALSLVQAALGETQDAAAHDWWLYQILSACGASIIRDDAPVLYYRQHGGNLIGANRSLRGKLQRILMLMGGRFARWNEVNLTALKAVRHLMQPEAQASLDAYSAARQGPLWARLRALHASGIYRQGRIDTAALYLACILRKL